METAAPANGAGRIVDKFKFTVFNWYYQLASFLLFFPSAFVYTVFLSFSLLSLLVAEPQVMCWVLVPACFPPHKPS